MDFFSKTQSHYVPVISVTVIIITSENVLNFKNEKSQKNQNIKVLFHSQCIRKVRSSLVFSVVQIVKFKDIGFYIRIT